MHISPMVQDAGEASSAVIEKEIQDDAAERGSAHSDKLQAVGSGLADAVSAAPTAATDAAVRIGNVGKTHLLAAGPEGVPSSTSRKIRWAHVGRQLDYVNIAVGIAFAVAAGVTSLEYEPATRVAYLYDATISYPEEEDSISGPAAVGVLYAALFVSALLIELLLFKARSPSEKLGSILHILLSGATALMLVLCLTAITKCFAGRLRPDFLARCQPTILSDQTVELFETATCTSSNIADVNQGRVSFPSGHSSSTMALGWFSCMYTVWSLYFRRGPQSRIKSERRRLRTQLLDLALLLLGIGQILAAWFIGVTRFIDNKHNISDIVGGFFLAIVLATPWFFRTAGEYMYLEAALGPSDPVAINIY